MKCPAILLVTYSESHHPGFSFASPFLTSAAVVGRWRRRSRSRSKERGRERDRSGDRHCARNSDRDRMGDRPQWPLKTSGNNGSGMIDFVLCFPQTNSQVTYYSHLQGIHPSLPWTKDPWGLNSGSGTLALRRPSSDYNLSVFVWSNSHYLSEQKRLSAEGWSRESWCSQA